MILTTSISKWGNGQGIRIPKNIYELFENFDGTYKKENIDWGEPQGNEIW